MLVRTLEIEPIREGPPTARPVLFRGTPLRAAKRFRNGTHRCAAPEETLERIRPHFRATGLTRVADVTGLDRIGIPTAIGYRPNSRSLSNSAGKGYTRAAAMVSAAMEAIEVYHAEYPRLPESIASYNAMQASGRIISRDQLSMTRKPLFSPDRPEIWVRGWDLMQQEEVAVPFAQVAMRSHPRQSPRLSMPFSTGSNGLASGNHPLEAMCAALLEVIERDAISCQATARSRAGHRTPRVAPEAIQHPLVLDLLDRFRAAQVMPVLFDCSVDTEVPVYMAYIYDVQNRHVGMYRGYGAHLDPQVAMIRALTEAAQSRLTYIAGSRDDYFRHDAMRHHLGDDASTIAEMQAIPAGARLEDRAEESTDSFEGDVNLLLAKLRRVGLEQVIVLDLTHEEIGIPVVRVIVPGLEGYMFQHYAPGKRARDFSAACYADD